MVIASIASATVAQATGALSGPYNVPEAVKRLQIHINISAVAGTSPTDTVVVEGLDSNGLWYTIYTTTALAAAGDTVQSVGPGCQTPVLIPDTIRVRDTIGGSVSPTVTRSISIIGQTEGN